MLDPPQEKARLVIIQATPFCNMSCCCCYLPDRFSPKSIDNRTLERTFDVPLLERIERLRERMKWENVDELHLVSSGNRMEEEDDWNDWSKGR